MLDVMARIGEQRSFLAADRSEIFYRHWPARENALQANGAIVLLHRGHEHGGRMEHLVPDFDLPEFAMFAWDARGHGLSSNSVPENTNLSSFVADLQAFVLHLRSAYEIAEENITLVGQSLGAVIAATWVHDYAPRIRCMVLASPAFKVKLYIPFARLGLTVAQALLPNLKVKSYVKGSALTHDPERISTYATDPLIRLPISVRILLSLYTTAERVVADSQAIMVPTQLLISGSDWVVFHEPQHRFFQQLSSAIKEKHVLPGFYHDTLGEKDRSIAIGKARSFILGAHDSRAKQPSLRRADLQGFTYDEFEAMRRPLPAWSLKGLAYLLTRFGLRIGAWFSQGLRLGIDTGFDSGSTLDYVYRNKPGGLGPLGRFIDRFYLNSIGWRGIRVRKRNLVALLRAAFDALREEGQGIHILDVAAGHGRYVVEAVEKHRFPPESIVLKDYSDLNVRRGSELIREKGMQSFARFEKGDAFATGAHRELHGAITLGIVSGLYELFPSNEMVSRSLDSLAEAIVPGGYLIYTGQPWHPQLEMIARTLSSHRDGAPWVMRRRTQAEMDELVESAGFRKVDQLIDEWGIFTVSIARRVPIDLELA